MVHICFWAIWFPCKVFGKILLLFVNFSSGDKHNFGHLPQMNTNAAIFPIIMEWIKFMNQGTSVVSLEHSHANLPTSCARSPCCDSRSCHRPQTTQSAHNEPQPVRQALWVNTLPKLNVTSLYPLCLNKEREESGLQVSDLLATGVAVPRQTSQLTRIMGKMAASGKKWKFKTE